MLEWYRHLYTGKKIRPRLGEVIGKLNDGIPVSNVYLITRATSPHNQLDIISSFYLLQKTVERRLPEVVGLALGREEAIELVADIVREVYEATGEAEIKDYLGSSGIPM